MEGVFSVWSYQESVDELKHKLLCTTYELESARMDAKVELKKNEEYIKRLLQLLNAAYHERDEARDQLRRVLDKVIPKSQTELLSVFSNLQSESSALKPKGLISTKTESDSLSDAYNHHSHGSSPVDSFIDTVSSPEMSNLNVGDSCNLGVPHQPVIRDINVPISMDIFPLGNISPSAGIISPGLPKTDHASSVIDNLTKGKTLPQQGKLLQAVMDAGPLLQTLLVAGPLPRWRNPPPLQQLQIPAVSIKGSNPENVKQKPVPSPNYMFQSSFGSSYLDMPSQMYSTSLLNLSNSPVSCLDNAELLSTPVNQDFSHRYNRTGKRLRLH